MNSKKIHDIPSSDRPREKAISSGIESLSDSELLALFISTGLKGENAIDIGKRILDSEGNLANLAKLNIKEISKHRGLGTAKSTLIAAAFELGSRVASQELKRVKLDSPKTIYEFTSPQFTGLTQESLRVVLVDAKMQLIRMMEVTRGTQNLTLCHPRDVLHFAIQHQAFGIILLHNHPSGDPTPSSADITMTNKMNQACEMMHIKFHDHIIIGTPSPNQSAYYSFKEYGKI